MEHVKLEVTAQDVKVDITIEVTPMATVKYTRAATVRDRVPRPEVAPAVKAASSDALVEKADINAVPSWKENIEAARATIRGMRQIRRDIRREYSIGR